MTTIRPTKSGVFPRLETGVHQVCLGNCTMFVTAIIHGDHGLFIGIEERGAYRFGHRADAGYVMEKLRLAPFKGDAANIADLINDQLYEPGSVERQGKYTEQLCAK